MSLAKDRTLTFGHRRKVYAVSTPTTEHGPIAKAIAACGDVRDFHVRCYACNELILPEWDQVEWEGKDDDTDEDRLRARKRALEAGECVATYACPHCEAELTQERWWFGVELGEWVSVGCEPGSHPESHSVGFRFSGLCSPWIGIQRAAAEYVGAMLEGMGALQNFFNGFLGVPFWAEGTHGDHRLQINQQTIWAAANGGGPRLEVPEWTQRLVAGVDSGKRDHPWVIRAYGEGYQSQLVDYGLAEDGDRLIDVLQRGYHGPGGRLWHVQRAAIDVGGGRTGRDQSRTEEVLALCKRMPGVLWPVKGYGGGGTMSKPISENNRMAVIDANYWKDVTAGYVVGGQWKAFPTVRRDYVLQVASEKKVLRETRIKKDGTTREVWAWVPHYAGCANHWWDSECYATVAAHSLGAGEKVVEVEYEYGPDEADDTAWTPVDQFWRRGKW